MIQLLGLVLISFFVTSFLLIPFIDYLFFLKNRRKKIAKKTGKDNIDPEKTENPLHNLLLAGKDLETPVGGGILLIAVVISLSFILSLFFSLNKNELFILISAICLFGLIGLIDDVRKLFVVFSGKYQGLRARFILPMQLLAGFFVALMLYRVAGINNIYVPVFGNLILGWWYIPLAILAMVAFANAYNIADGLDGLAAGLLLICLVAFLVLAHSVFDNTLSIFVGIWIGGLIAYLYFNIFPARIYLGDAGAYGFGAALAVVGLLTGKILGLAVIGGVYIIIIISSLLQILHKKIYKRKLFPIAPIHMYFKLIGWEEPKIVMRFWLAEIIFAILGLWLAFLSR